MCEQNVRMTEESLRNHMATIAWLVEGGKPVSAAAAVFGMSKEWTRRCLKNIRYRYYDDIEIVAGQEVVEQ